MSRSLKYPLRMAALLTLAALFAYGPSPIASAEPASPEEARQIAGVQAENEDRADSSFPEPTEERPSEGNASGEGRGEAEKARKGRTEPKSKKLMLTIPRLGLDDVKVGDSPDQSYLDREGIMHLSGTGFPYQKGSNTYIAAHAIGYAQSRVTYAFRDLEDMKNGDRVTVEDTSGETYQYRVYERMIVNPSDFWVTKPVEGKKVITLQTCWPEPSFEKRLIVRAEIVK